MTKLHDDAFCLSGRQRNYRTPGAKLKPRDAYTAHMMAGAYRNRRQMRRADAHEARVMGYRSREDAYERKLKSLSSRARKLVLSVLNSQCTERTRGYQEPITVIGRQRQRVINAAINHVNVQAAIEWDRKTLANAY